VSNLAVDELDVQTHMNSSCTIYPGKQVVTHSPDYPFKSRPRR
jgi:hypothetical protein